MPGQSVFEGRKSLDRLTRDALMTLSRFQGRLLTSVVTRDGAESHRPPRCASYSCDDGTGHTTGPFRPPEASCMSQNEVTPKHPHCDIALSFAGEDRDYVEAVAESLRVKSIRVFYNRLASHD